MTVRTPYSRVWSITDRAGPANVPVYQGRARAMGPSWSLGDRTPVREPDPNRYGGFIIVDAIKGERGLPTLSLEIRYQWSVSEFLEIARRGCPIDIQVHLGKCQDPRDFNGGWDKIFVLEGADLSNWSTGELGALEQGEDAVINESVDLTGLDAYEIKQLLLSELAAVEIIGPVIDVIICDRVTCGECGLPSTGCQVIFAITDIHTASPGLPAELIYSQDGGATIGETNITTLPANQAPSAMACVGLYLVVVSNGDPTHLHYSLLADILNGAEVWTASVGELSAGGAPNAIFSLGSAYTWIVGDNGYVYFSDDITAGADIQDAGVATTEDLQAIHGVDEENLVAVGDNNAVIYTRDGRTWASITGPSPATLLTCVWMRSKDEWFVGTVDGHLFYTRDAGTNWTEKTFPGSGSGTVKDIVFSTPTVGYLAHNTAVFAGRILRTLDGGNSWYVLPEGTGSIPANDYVRALAASDACPNVVYGGGLADDATDGFLVKGA